MLNNYVVRFMYLCMSFPLWDCAFFFCANTLLYRWYIECCNVSWLSCVMQHLITLIHASALWYHVLIGQLPSNVVIFNIVCWICIYPQSFRHRCGAHLLSIIRNQFIPFHNIVFMFGRLTVYVMYLLNCSCNSNTFTFIWLVYS